MHFDKRDVFLNFLSNSSYERKKRQQESFLQNYLSVFLCNASTFRCNHSLQIQMCKTLCSIIKTRKEIFWPDFKPIHFRSVLDHRTHNTKTRTSNIRDWECGSHCWPLNFNICFRSQICSLNARCREKISLWTRRFPATALFAQITIDWLINK